MGFSVFFPRGQMPIHASMSEFHDLEVLSLADDKERFAWEYWMGILDGQEREGENTSSIERRCGKQRALDRMVFMCHVSDHQNVGSVRAFKSQSGEQIKPHGLGI